MTPDGAKEKRDSMIAARDRLGKCPSCQQPLGADHLRNCLWIAEFKGINDFIAKAESPHLEGPNLLWGDPCGTYEIEMVPGGAMFFYRQKQTNGGMLEIKVPFSTQALAEMQGLLSKIDFGFKVELPDGRFAGHA